MTDDGEFLFECVEDKVVHPVSVVEALARVGHADVGARDRRNFRSGEGHMGYGRNITFKRAGVGTVVPGFRRLVRRRLRVL